MSPAAVSQTLVKPYHLRAHHIITSVSPCASYVIAHQVLSHIVPPRSEEKELVSAPAPPAHKRVGASVLGHLSPLSTPRPQNVSLRSIPPGRMAHSRDRAAPGPNHGGHSDSGRRRGACGRVSGHGHAQGRAVRNLRRCGALGLRHLRRRGVHDERAGTEGLRCVCRARKEDLPKVRGERVEAGNELYREL